MANFFLDGNGNVTVKKKSKGTSYIMDAKGNITTEEEEEKKKRNQERLEALFERGKKKKEEQEKAQAESKKDDDGLDFVKAGTFEDGTSFTEAPIDLAVGGINTVADLGGRAVKGALGLFEGVSDLILHGAGYAAGALGLKDQSVWLHNEANIKTVDNMFKGYEELVDPYSFAGKTTQSVAEGVGQMAPIVATGGMASAAGLGKIGTTVATTALTGASGTGSGISEAYEGGATDAEAVTYGVIAGASDAMTELLFGGLGKSFKAVGLSTGVSSADDMLAKTLSSKIKNIYAKNLVEFGVKSSAEGLEEVLAGTLQAAGKKATYMSEEEFSKIIEDENLLEQFVVGALTSGVAQSGVVPGMKNGSLIEANKTGKDFITGNTQNEQAVIDAEVDKRIAEAEKDGEKVSGRDKNKIIEQVKEDMEKGRISTDTIEEVLGGVSYNQFKQGVDSFVGSETYKAYNDAITEEKTLREEFEELQKVKVTDADLGQQSRFNEVKSRLEEIKKEAKSATLRKELQTEIDRINGLKKKLSQEVSEKVKNERLSESYRELQRSTEKFQADPMQYDNEYARKTVQNIVDSGIANNTNETREFVDFMAKLSADKGVVFSMTDAERLAGTRYAKDGATTNGYVTSDGEIVINKDSKKRLNSVVGHEITHVLEGTGLYDKLQEAVIDYAKKKGDYDSRLKAITELYEKYNPEADPTKELTADLVGDYLFTDRDFINKLSTEHRNVFQKIYDEIKYLVKVATGSKEARALERAKKMFEAAYRENVKGKPQAETNFSLEKVGDTEYVKSDKSIFEKEDGTLASEREVFDSLVGQTIHLPDGDVKVVKSLPKKDMYKELYKRQPKYKQNVDDVKKLNSDVNYNMEELLTNSKAISVNKPDVDNRHKDQGIIAFDTRKVKFYDGSKAYNVEFSIGVLENGERVAYAKKFYGYDAELTKKIQAAEASGSTNTTMNQRSVSGNIIPQNSEKSIGEVKKSLTPEQEEYFKDSVVRDENGNLKIMYHGTSKGGHTMFDPYGKANYGLFGAGSYFTDSKTIAESYTKKGKGDTPQVYESYLNITNPIDMDAQADADAWRNALPEADFPESGTNEQFYRAMEEYFEDNEYARWEAAETAMGVIEEMGYDGITHIGGGRVDADGERHRVYIAFQPEQIKNIDNAKPTSDPDIRYSLSDESANKIKEVGLEYDEKSETVSYSLSSLEDAFDYNKGEMEFFAAKNEYVDALAKTIAENKDSPTRAEIEKARRYVDSLFLVHDMIAADRDRLDFEAAVDKSAWVSNSEYGGSIDFSTLCAKRRLFTGTFDAIQEALPDTVLNENDFLAIRNMLLDKGLESPCSMCYVEGSRAKHGDYVEKWLKEYLATDPEWEPQIADFTSSTRLEQTRINHPEAYKAYQAAMNKLAQRKPKEASVRTDYKGEILTAFEDDTTVAEKNKNGGVRFNSFSDFEIIHALDAMQVITDMARVGLNGQAYTKVKEFAEAFGNTGLKINLSLVAKDVDADGNLIFDEVNGMNYAEAMDIRGRYSENVGSVIVVFNEAQLKAALADGNIDYVLPFHRSQWKKSQYAMMGLPAQTKDFTMVQNDRTTNPKTGKPVKLSKLKQTATYTNDITGEIFEIKDNIMPNQYWDFSKSGRENANRYLDYINANGMTPKFDSVLEKVNGKWVLPEGAVGDGYYKLLIDFKMYDNNGWGAPQKPVVPEFNMPYIQGMLESYTGGHKAFPVAHDVVTAFVESKKGVKNSLSASADATRTGGGYAVYGDNIRVRDKAEFDFAPLPPEVAPVQDTAQPTVTETEDYPIMDNSAPTTEEEANSIDGLEGITDADVPPMTEAPYYGDNEDATPADPFEDRDIKDVGNRKVNAYMYENPEVKPFFQEEANVMLGELQRTTKGERFYNMDVYYETNGEAGITGTSRNTSDDIAYLLDELKYSYKQIESGLNAIIEDNGKENNAVSKRIEFLLNDRLMNGYQDFEFGLGIPPNQDYVNLLNEKQIQEYNDEARKKFFEVADDYAPVADMPMRVTNPTLTEKVDDIAPVRGRDYEAVTPKKPKENRLARRDVGTPEEQKIAQILDEEPTPENRENRAWARFVANVFDKGAVFEKVALKNKNRELIGKWNYMLYSEARAQNLIGNGTDLVKSLNSIQEEVTASGKAHEFYEYLYHKHNVDRMNLAERYEGKENLPVFGYSVTSEMSDAAARQLEAANPEFAAYAQDIYDYNNHLRQLLVDNDVISQETADLWAEMYPHYVPIRRAGDKGIDINVPLDTGRTTVNAPVKRATGGNSDILPLFDTMAQRTIQTYKAISKNSFGVELKNTLGTTIEANPTDVDDVIDTIDAQDGLLQEGKNGRNPTFTVFENGERITYEITKDMYDALKPMSEGLAYTNKVLNTASNFHRGLLTEYNPVFMLTNAIKDVQDVLINSQHPARTYAKVPEAFSQLVSKGYWYDEYMANGGNQNSYFDNDTGTFKTENKGLAKILDLPPFSTISALNNFIEMTPRLAEYIASREAGRSVEVSMLDAARVTTNFRAGGDVTKFLNRNGATFLNASVQGAMQQVRNFREAKANGLKGWVALATKFAIAGLPAVILNNLVWDDDDEYEELSDYVKQSYYVVAKTDDGKFIRIPKGRTLAVIQSAFDQVSNAVTGDDEVDLKSFLELAVSNLAPNNPIENNILAPIIQVANNETWYGEDLVPSRLQDLPAAEQFDESTDALSKWLGQKMNISPVKINYLLDQYTGGVGDTVLPMLTPEAESGDNSFWGNLMAPLKSKFTTDSVMNNQNVSDFYDKKDELTTNAKASGASDEDILKNKYMNSINAELADLYAQKREIQNSSLSDKEKYDQVRAIQNQIVNITRESLDAYENVNIDGEYATVGDKYFKLNDDGEWQKLSDDQVTKYTVTSEAEGESYATNGDVHYRWYQKEGESEGEWRKITDKEYEKQEEVTSALGISANEYWSNKEEYNYAYEYPENYAVSKAVGGYEAFRTYSSELSDIKADKDASGKTISGSRKEKVLNYINGLDITYGEKLVLFKNEYNADDSFNYEIIEYLNSRSDLSYAEIETILKKIGFIIDANGNVTW